MLITIVREMINMRVVTEVCYPLFAPRILGRRSLFQLNKLNFLIGFLKGASNISHWHSVITNKPESIMCVSRSF